MNRAALLGGTALVAVMAFSPAMAGSVGTGKNMSLDLAGEVRFSAYIASQDEDTNSSSGLTTDAGELAITASGSSDNGFTYGVNLVLLANVSDTQNGDKLWIDIGSDDFGTMHLGDIGSAADEFKISGASALAGRGGFDGEHADVFDFGGSWIGGGTDPVSGNATKISYYSPSLNGFQIGASFTPDSGAAGSSFGEKDNNGSFENVLSAGVMYSAEVNGASISASWVYESGDNETATNASGQGMGIGASASFGNITIAAGYASNYDTGLTNAQAAAGADAGSWMSAGIGYNMGAYNISLGVSSSAVGNADGAPDSTHTAISVDMDTEVAPGWTLAAGITFSEAENRGGVSGDDNEGTSVIIQNIWAF